jgi:hypothetical protein
MKEKNKAAVELGTKGGNATAKKGSNYYSEISRKRKSFGGGWPKGRPRK